MAILRGFDIMTFSVGVRAHVLHSWAHPDFAGEKLFHLPRGFDNLSSFHDVPKYDASVDRTCLSPIYG